MLNLDFSGVKSIEALEEGTYMATIEVVEETVAKSSGNPMLKVKYSVDGTNNKLFDNFVLTDAAMWKLKELLGSLGYDTSEIVDLDVNELVGQQVQLIVIQEEYEGNTVNRVKKILPAA